MAGSDGTGHRQVRALFMLSIPAPLAELGVSQELKAALLKLTAAFPATRGDDEEHVRSRFYPDAVGWENDGSPTPHLRIVHQAVWQDRRIVLKYRLGSRGRDAPARLTPPDGLRLTSTLTLSRPHAPGCCPLATQLRCWRRKNCV